MSKQLDVSGTDLYILEHDPADAPDTNAIFSADGKSLLVASELYQQLL